jgi:hypothetical protein
MHGSMDEKLEMAAMLSDAARMVLMFMDHGGTLEEMRHAMTRDPDGCPASLIGVMVDNPAGFAALVERES